jgi:hypothetical protein
MFFLSRVAEHFTDHYQTWEKLKNFAHNIIITVPDMDDAFKIYQENLELDYERESISFKTLRTVYEIYSEPESENNKNMELHKVFYCNQIFQNKKMLEQFLPGLKLSFLDYVIINGYKHLELSLEVISNSNVNYNLEKISEPKHIIYESSHNFHFDIFPLISDYGQCMSSIVKNVRGVITEFTCGYCTAQAGYTIVCADYSEERSPYGDFLGVRLLLYFAVTIARD